MRRSVSTIAACVGIAALALLGACSRSEPPPAVEAPKGAAPAPFRIVSVDLGNAIGADKKVSQPTASFGAADTIYASVTSEGSSPKVDLKARWTYEDGQLVNESLQSIAPTGPAATEFHIAKPSGWPTGKYKVEILADGTSVMAKEFAVN
jgi:hypothetical protein